MIIKVAVVLFVIFVGIFFVNPANWTSVPVTDRLMPEELEIPVLAEEKLKEGLSQEEAQQRIDRITQEVVALQHAEAQLPERAAKAQAAPSSSSS